MTRTLEQIGLKSSAFRKGREAGWRELEQLIGRIESNGVRSLEPDELMALPMLYRSAISGLSVARAIALDWNLLAYLEMLCLRGHACVYGARGRPLDLLLGFFLRDLPRSFRRCRWHILVAALLLMLATHVGWSLVLLDPGYYGMFVPDGLANGRTPGATRGELAAVLFNRDDAAVAHLLTFSSALFIHNMEVGLLGFGLGLALGLPTLLLTLYQGLIMGAMGALYDKQGLALDFIAWLSVHGVTEILAILMCFAGGLRLAEGVVFPGRMTRTGALAMLGPEAARLAVGGILMLVLAGLLEGVVRQVVTDTGVRLAIGSVTAVFWAGYFIRAGRRDEP